MKDTIVSECGILLVCIIDLLAASEVGDVGVFLIQLVAWSNLGGLDSLLGCLMARTALISHYGIRKV